MTREEIMSKGPGAELDVLVAEKILGWEHREHTGLWTHNRNRQWSVPAQQLPRSSRDIRAAWRVIEHLYAARPQWGVRIEGVPVGVIVKFYNHDWPLTDTRPWPAGPAPYAICLAALLTLEAGS